MAGLLITTAALLLAFTYTTVVAQHATGIYAQGQGRWVQAHERAIMYLHDYARTYDPRYFSAFRESLRIPHAFERARAALEAGPPDRETAVREFIAGDLTRADAERAATFALMMRHAAPARRLFDAWEGGDTQLDSLEAIAEEMRAGEQRGDTAATQAMLRRVDVADRELNRREQEFTAALADTARMLPPVVLGVGILLGLVLVAIGVVMVHRVARAADRSQAAERAHFEKLRALMETLPDSISWYDRSRRITYVNPALERLTGVRREQAIGLGHGELVKSASVPPEILTQWQDAVARAFAGERDLTLLVDMRASDGRIRWLQVRFVPQFDGDDVESVLAIGRDVTALREFEATVRERDIQLQQAQKFEAVGRLAGGVAHEFNNILTAITGNLELAMLSLPDGSEARSDLHAALTAARRASGLTRQLLVFARPDHGDRRLVDIARLVGELEVMLRRFAGEQVEVVVNQHASPAVTLAHPGQLQQILLNLVSNARDAMPKGGVIHIDIDRARASELRRRGDLVAPTAAEAESQGKDAGDWLTLTVRDTGHGMTDDTVERLFEPFFTTKPPGAGTGLGLPVVHGIVMRLGGRIYLETALGTGTALTIALPAAARITHTERTSGEHVLTSTGELPVPRPARSAERRDGVVLLVEDEAPVRLAARRMLESAGYTVLEAKHGEDALMQWEQRPVSVVVTDFMMPGMNGAELLARLRERRPDLPAVIVSGYTGGDTIDEAALGDRTALLQKPFARTELIERVDALLSM